MLLLLQIYRRSYLSGHVLLNLLSELRKRDNIRGFRAHYVFYTHRV